MSEKKIKAKAVQKESKAEEMSRKLQEYKDLLQRLQAEFENYKKRIDKEAAMHIQYGNSDIIKKMLPLLDSFELALKATSNLEEFRKGIELIYAQLHSLLESEGLREINAVGEKFDPYKHEALLQEESDKDNIVLEELQKGYMMKDAVLRHSRVKIGVKSKKS